jgi:hypothetical protein
MRTVLLIAGAAILLTSCSALSEEQKSSLLDVYNDMLANGQITQVQYEALRDALTGQSGWWRELAGQAGQIALAIAGSLFGVRLWRGGINNRNGSTGAT